MKLPLWRLLSGSAVLLALVTILIALAPLYVADYQLRRYLRELASDQAPEAEVQRKAAARARELSLPVQPSQVSLSLQGTRRRVEIRYAVRKDFGLYEADLHFHPSGLAEGGGR